MCISGKKTISWRSVRLSPLAKKRHSTVTKKQKAHARENNAFFLDSINARMNIGEVNHLREDVKALIAENKRISDEMAEKQRKSDAEIKRISDENKDIRDEMTKLNLKNELKCKFVFQLISFHPTLNDYFFPVLVK